MEYQFPITAINRGGETRIFYDAEALWAFIRDRSNGSVGGYWTESYGWRFNDQPRALIKVCDNADSRFWTDVRSNDWILRDNRGRAVDKERIPVARAEYNGKWAARWRRREADKRRAAEAGLPIPGTGNCRRYKHSPQGAYSKNGKNGAHNQRKGIKQFEDPKIKRGEIDEL